MYFNKINSFADAEARYADTKPIRGNNMDMRPLGKRSRKWERVLKIDDNCYALLEYGTGSDTDWSGRAQWCYASRSSYACACPMGTQRRWH
jgi:hypothetical protein